MILERNKVFGDFINELNKNLEILLNKGSGALTMKQLKPIIKSILRSKFLSFFFSYLIKLS
jgi:hypothetical protein